MDEKKRWDKKNRVEKGTGEALRSFGKCLGNSSYGQQIKKDHHETIQFINSVEEQSKFLTNHKIKDIVTNDEEDGYHIFIGDKYVDETKELTSRCIFEGSFGLAYSHQMIDDIINTIYGEDRFNKNGLSKQVLYGDTDSLFVHSSQTKLLEKKFYWH